MDEAAHCALLDITSVATRHMPSEIDAMGFK
jgi:hypothetical protein